MRTIGFLVFPSFNLLDLSGPLAAFDAPNRLLSPRPYDISVVSETGGCVTSSSGVQVMTRKIDDAAFDTAIICGGGGTFGTFDCSALYAFAQHAGGNSRRVASVCTGAFILAGAGLLDGRRATTHWRKASDLQRNYPRVRVDADRIFIKDGPIWTSAGITAGIDLALALIEEDLGADDARAVARELVVYYRRHGGQSQFSTLLELSPDSERIARALRFAREHMHENISIDHLAEIACFSRRQFDRAFMNETGQSPAKAIERLRADAARARVEMGSEPIEAIARSVGFSDPERMRRAFIRVFGQPPQALRRTGRTDSTRSWSRAAQ
ncbi:GlxA family transcriptional regulator [Paralcaligenes sp. KSB-10]|uniref:GlxA family transcriptional regulator n=1 Tax=Paralcaligenes sp. KSB-10 TaxID=2901142 RepID=UPI001E510C37|nr:GlxA family transcriptional regulator [Paralcaligenes sp. KSB-10]UHL62492.1 GlxA family transcriptional regulator [Paralcaligenes sp. KSB-10]